MSAQLRVLAAFSVVVLPDAQGKGGREMHYGRGDAIDPADLPHWPQGALQNRLTNGEVGYAVDGQADPQLASLAEQLADAAAANTAATARIKELEASLAANSEKKPDGKPGK